LSFILFQGYGKQKKKKSNKSKITETKGDLIKGIGGNFEHSFKNIFIYSLMIEGKWMMTVIDTIIKFEFSHLK